MLLNYDQVVKSDNTTLLVFLIDKSSSMKKWEEQVSSEFEDIKGFLNGIEDSSVVLILRADFSGNYEEKDVCKPSDFSSSYITGGKSILYYSICRITESLLFPNEGYIKKAQNSGYNLKTIFFTITDGKDEGSKESGYYLNEAQNAIRYLKQNNVETHLLLFGHRNKEILSLGYEHIHKFKRDSKGLTDMFDTIKQCSKSMIEGIDLFSNV